MTAQPDLHVVDPRATGSLLLRMPVSEYRERTWQEPETGGWVTEQSKCTQCHAVFEDGELVVWSYRRASHPACFKSAVEKSSELDAWLTIAEGIERNPSKFTAATVRATLQNLARLASAASPVVQTDLTGEEPESGDRDD